MPKRTMNRPYSAFGAVVAKQKLTRKFPVLAKPCSAMVRMNEEVANEMSRRRGMEVNIFLIGDGLD